MIAAWRWELKAKWESYRKHCGSSNRIIGAQTPFFPLLYKWPETASREPGSVTPLLYPLGWKHSPRGAVSFIPEGCPEQKVPRGGMAQAQRHRLPKSRALQSRTPCASRSTDLCPAAASHAACCCPKPSHGVFNSKSREKIILSLNREHASLYNPWRHSVPSTDSSRAGCGTTINCCGLALFRSKITLVTVIPQALW